MAGVKISALPESTGLTGQQVPGVQTGVTVKTSGTLSGAQIITALGFSPAPINSPAFTGTPTAPTPATIDNSTKLATTAYVQAQGYVTALTAPVTSVAGKVGDVLLVVGDVSGAAPLASPTFTGIPRAPTPSPGDNSTQIATTAFITGGGFQAALQWQNQGSNVGTPGSETVINAVGGGLVASISGGTLSLTADVSMPTLTIKGNNTGGTADYQNLTPAQVAAMLPIFTQTTKGLAPLVGITPSSNTFLSSLGTWITPGGGATPGTVTSVDLTAPVEITVAGTPITSAGTIALSWTSRSQNLVFASPNGSGGTPAFRALVATDLPNTAVTPGTYGDSTHVGQFTVDAQGRMTFAGLVAITAGGSGTVTSFSAGTLSPLFTTSVATATTTPALTFALSNAAAHTFFGNFTGGSTAPSFGTPGFADLPALVQSLNGLTGALSVTSTDGSVAVTASGTTVDLSVAGEAIIRARLATTTALVGTYNNGSSGVGATLTLTATGVLPIDGQNVALNDIILIKDQISTFQNGAYKCTTAGAIGVSAVFTRDTRMDQSTEFTGALISTGPDGTTNADKLYECTAVSPVTVGTTAITFQSVGATANVFIEAIGTTFDGGGTVLTVGSQGRFYVPYACTINSVTLLADTTGSIVIDILAASYASYPSNTSICASAKPTITSDVKSQDATLTGWTTAVAAGTTFIFNINSVTAITNCTLVLKVTKS